MPPVSAPAPPPPPPPPAPPGAPAPRGKGGNKALLVIIVLAVLVLAGVGVMAFLNRGGSSAPGRQRQQCRRPGRQRCRARAQRQFNREAMLQGDDEFANVRSAPAADAPIVARINAGETFNTYQQDGIWWQVRIAGGLTGYIERAQVRMRDPVAVPPLEPAPGQRGRAGARQRGRRRFRRRARSSRHPAAKPTAAKSTAAASAAASGGSRAAARSEDQPRECGRDVRLLQGRRCRHAAMPSARPQSASAAKQMSKV